MCLSQPQLINVQLRAQAGQQENSAFGQADCNFVLGTSPLRLLTHPCLARTDNGGPLKMITLIDEYTRKCLSIRIARQLPSTDVLGVLSEAIEKEGAPSYICSDSGSEVIVYQLQRWLSDKKIKTIYSDPVSP